MSNNGPGLQLLVHSTLGNPVIPHCMHHNALRGEAGGGDIAVGIIVKLWNFEADLAADAGGNFCNTFASAEANKECPCIKTYHKLRLQ